MAEIVDRALAMPRVEGGKVVRTAPLGPDGRFTSGCFLGLTVDDAEEVEEDYLRDCRRWKQEQASEETFYALSEGKDLGTLFAMWAWAKTKDYGFIKIEPTFAQKDTIDLLMKAGREDTALLLEILKARQLGQTTGIQASWFLLASMLEDKRFLTMAHKQEKTAGIVRMQVDMHKAMPFRPQVRFALSKRYAKWERTGCELQVESAEDSDPGRSSSYNFIHMSEHPFFPNAELIDGAFGSTKPNVGFYAWIKEGTGNGVGNAFYRTWVDGERGKNDWTCRFHGWWQHPMYRVSVKPEDMGKFTADKLEEHEQEMVAYCRTEGWELEPEQIAWYRRELNTTYNGDLDKMWQEHPAWPMQAFLSSGRPVFDTRGFERLIAVQRGLDPVFAGDILD